jgi:hypothetical protein
MSVQSQVQAAEEALRQALINALAEGDEAYLSELFTQYQAVGDLNRKISNTIRFTDNTSGYYARNSEFNFNLNSDYLDRPGSDLDSMDDFIAAAGPVHIPGGLGEDVISFGDYKSREDS